MSKQKWVLDNDELVSEDDKLAVPSEIMFKIPGDPELAGDFVRDFLRAGYDISVGQAYSDSFCSPKIDHYRIAVTGDLNLELPEGEEETEK